MSYKLTFHPVAEKEYLDSVKWYEECKAGLAEPFIREVSKILDLLEKNPFLFPAKKKDFREALLKIFPYVIVFKVNENKKQVIIVAVFHTSRNPIHKYKR